MPSTFFGLNIGTTGLFTYQAAMNTTGHNVANAETNGYTRQILNQKAGIPLKVNSSYGMAGTGVEATGIVQTRNAYYDMKYRNSNTVLGSYSAKQYGMTEIENYFNEVTVDGFTTSFNKLYDSLQSLSTDSSNPSKRGEITNYANNLTDYFNSMATNLKSIQEECNFEVKNQVDRINSLGQQIATVTKQINVMESSSGSTANDLRDQRQLLLDDLSNIVNISYNENVVGNNVGVTSFVVKIDGQTLVNTGDYNTLQVVPRTNKVNQNDADGLYDIQWSNGNDFSTGSTSLGGYLKSLIEVRDGNNNENLRGTVSTGAAGANQITVTNSNINSIEKLNAPIPGTITIGNEEYTYSNFTVTYDAATKTSSYTFTLDKNLTANATGKNVSVGDSIDYKGIPYYMGQLNQLVRTYAKEYNDLQKSGVDKYGKPGIDFFNGRNPVTGANYTFANYEDYYNLTASNFTITDKVREDPSLVVTGSDVQNGVEKNDILKKLLALRDDKSMFKQGTPASFFQTLVAEVGIDTDKANKFAKNQDDILKMVKNQRLSVSGVDADEEAMNMLKFQHAFDLSAKVIQIMNEVYDKLINGTGV
jgi:flagellar hook-associated protein 1 FlgK